MAKSNRKAAAAIATPTSVNAQQEKFLQLLAEGNVTQARAYELAYGIGGKSAEVSACQLLRFPKFKARLAEIQADNAIAAQVSVASVTRMYRRIYENSMAVGEHGPAVLATTGIAKLHGLVIDKVQAEVLMRKPSESPDAPTEMSADQWLQQFGKIPVIETDFQVNAAAPVPEPRTAEPRSPEPHVVAGAPTQTPIIWESPAPEPDPFAAASAQHLRKAAASREAQPDGVIDMGEDYDDRPVSAPRRPAPSAAATVQDIETLDGDAGAGDGAEMFAERPEPKPRDLIAEAFEASARD